MIRSIGTALKVSLLLAAACTANAQPVYLWEASSGLTPDAAEPAYELFLSNGANDPVIDAGALVISTDVNNQNAFYLQTEPLLNTDRPFTLRFRMRLESGSSSAVARGPASVFVTVRPATGILLSIDIDRVFFGIAPGVPGAAALVDTDDAFHDYRLEFDGMDTFTLFHDEIEVLTADAYMTESDHGTIKRIGWGEGSSFAFGQASWESFGHSAIEPIFSDSFEDFAQPNGER